MVKVKVHLDQTSHLQFFVPQTLPQRRALLRVVLYPSRHLIYLFSYRYQYLWSWIVLFSSTTLYEPVHLAIFTNMSYIFIMVHTYLPHVLLAF